MNYSASRAVCVFVCSSLVFLCGCKKNDEAKKAHGVKQLEMMLSDRPKMVNALKSYPEIRKWIINQYEGRDTKFKIFWDPAKTKSGRLVEHMYPFNGNPAFIRVENMSTGIDQLCGAIFEFFNIRNYNEFLKIHKQTCLGKVTGEEYALAHLRLEFNSALETKKFIQNSLQGCISPKKNWHYKHLLQVPETFNKFLKKDYGMGFDPRKYYYKHYDIYFVPYLKGQK